MLATLSAVVGILALTGGATAKNFVLAGPGYLTISRMDPIISPGDVGGHVHQVFGGSRFHNQLSSTEDMLKAECSSTKVGADKSNYWTPLLYWINKNGTYTPMTSNTRLYYSGGDEGGQKVHAFPPGLRMISGLPTRRDPGDIRTQGLAISPTRGKVENGQFIPRGKDLPAPPAEGVMMMAINFPSCGWANQTLDSEDHFSHMTWPIEDGGGQQWWNPNGGKCPDTHPIKYPRILIETMYIIEPYMKEEWRTDDTPNFILANGDTTGVTFHADFVNGWDTGVLQGAIDQCFGVDDTLEDCAPFAPTLQVDKRFDCRIQSEIPAEDIGWTAPLTELPGCNPRWDWDGDNDNKPADCPAAHNPGWVAPNLQFNGPPGNGERFPIVLPGVDTSNTSTLRPAVGWSEQQPPSIVPWAKDSQLKVNITTVLFGTQEEVDAAHKNGNPKADAKLYGGNPAPFTATVPATTATYDTAGVQTTHVTASFFCETNIAYGGLPCGTTSGPWGGARSTVTPEPTPAPTAASQKRARRERHLV